MAIRVKQIIFDEDINISGFNLTGLRRFIFTELPDGTSPLPNEILYADDTLKVDRLLVVSRLQAGAGNTALFIRRAIEAVLDTRNVTWAYDSANRVTQLQERDGANPVKTLSFTYDSLNRVATATEITLAGTLISTYTYVGASFDIATVTRTVS
jgi:hypothetical protein